MKFNAHSLSVLALGCSIATASTEQMDPITVTGQNDQKGLNLSETTSASSRLGLSINDTPASVEVITHKEMAIKADWNAMRAVTRSTGFSSNANQGNGGTSMAVRGFTGHSSIVQTYDGTQMFVGAGTRTFPADTWPLEKIEVLRGPGSVVNGVGAIGATINYVPKDAKFGDIQNEIDASLGSFNLRRLGFGSGGTLTDTLAYRIDVLNHESDGYVDNGDESKQVVSGSVLYRPNDDLDVTLSIDYSDVEPSRYWGTPLVDDRIIDSTRENNYNIDNGQIEYEDWWPRVGVEWQLSDSVTLRSETFYLEANRHWKNVETYDYNETSGRIDRSFYLEILHELDQVGNRTDFVFDITTAGVAHKISVGAELNQIDFTHFNNRPYHGESEVSLNSPDVGTWEDEVENDTSLDFSSDTTQYAVFIEDNIVFNEKWSVVAGLRKDEYDYSRTDVARNNGGKANPEPAEKISNDFSGTSWRLGTVFKPVEDISLYAQYSQALDPIGSVLTSTNPDLKLAEGTQFEVGIKQSLWDEKFQYTLAIYDIEKENLESSDPGGISRQIGQQSSQGIELDVFIQPTKTVSMDFNIAFVDAEYDEFRDGTLPEDDYSGNTPRHVPDMTANLWVNWQFTPEWMLGAGSRYVDERFSDHANTNATKLPDYVVYDASLIWDIDPSLTLSLHGKNLTDEEDYVLSSYGGTQWVLAEGRSFQLGLNYQF